MGIESASSETSHDAVSIVSSVYSCCSLYFIVVVLYETAPKKTMILIIDRKYILLGNS